MGPWWAPGAFCLGDLYLAVNCLAILFTCLPQSPHSTWQGNFLASYYSVSTTLPASLFSFSGSDFSEDTPTLRLHSLLSTHQLPAVRLLSPSLRADSSGQSHGRCPGADSNAGCSASLSGSVSTVLTPPSFLKLLCSRFLCCPHSWFSPTFLISHVPSATPLF